MIPAATKHRLFEHWSYWGIVSSLAKNCGVLLLFLTVPASAALGDERQESWNRCKSSDFQQSIAACSALIQSGELVGRELAIAFYARGRTYRLKGDAVHAIEDYDHALQLSPNFKEAFYGRALAFRSRGQYDNAIHDLSEVLRIDSKSVDALTARGSSYSHQGQYARAVRDYNQALEIDPHCADALFNRGRAEEFTGDHDNAIRDYTQALELTPRDADAFWGRGVSYARKSDYQHAIDDYNHALQLHPNADLYHDRGIAYLREGNYFAAIKDGLTFRLLKYPVMAALVLILVIAALAGLAIKVFQKRANRSGPLNLPHI